MSHHDIEIFLDGKLAGRHRLVDGRVCIGRSPASDLVLESSAISRSHARLEVSGPVVVVRDLGSASGTRVRGVRIDSVCSLHTGDEISIGPYVLRLVARLGPKGGLHPGRPDAPQVLAGLREVMRAILELTTVVGVADLKVVLEALLEQTTIILSADRGHIVLVTEEGVSPLMTHVVGGSKPDADFSRTICRKAVESRVPQLLSVDPSSPEGQALESLRAINQPTMIAAIPLVDHSTAENKVLGVMYLEIPQPGSAILTFEPDLLRELSRLGGGVLRTAHDRRQLISDRDQWRWLAAQIEDEPDLFRSARSSAMQPVLEMVRRVSPTDVTVMIEGETGTGKDVVARTIHRMSQRAQRPFVAINCAAIPTDLIEAELFGCERGAFTGAIARRVGRIEAARGGTLFLDEIGDMQIEVQTKLLRVLETRTFELIGGNETLQADVRILAATHQNLSELVKHGKFREDLFYRLNVVRIQVPPLRGRLDDIEALVHQMLVLGNRRFRRRLYGITPEALIALRNHRWSGNIRELRNAIERAFILGSGHLISLESLGLASSSSLSDSPPGTPEEGRELPEQESLPPVKDPGADNHGDGPTLEDYLALHEMTYVQTTLDRFGWNITKAAKTLGMTPPSLHRKLRQLGLKRPERFPSR